MHQGHCGPGEIMGPLGIVHAGPQGGRAQARGGRDVSSTSRSPPKVMKPVIWTSWKDRWQAGST
eukprot:7312402-Heterocapsa_arctica.AAC.1